MRSEDISSAMNFVDDDMLKSANSLRERSLNETVTPAAAAAKTPSGRKIRRAALAIAACAVLVAAAFPVYKALNAPKLHSFVLQDNGQNSVVTSSGVTDSSYDYFSSNTTAVEEEANILPEGSDTSSFITQEHLPFISADGTSPSDSRPEPNDADPPSPPSDAAAESAANYAYQNLMAHFNGTYPDWYGGAYLNENKLLSVLRVGAPDRELELEITEIARGSSAGASLVFESAKYSYSHLLELQEKVCALLGSNSSWGCGVDDMHNRVELSISEEAATDELLAALHKLDPDDDAILVTVTPDFVISYAIGIAE